MRFIAKRELMSQGLLFTVTRVGLTNCEIQKFVCPALGTTFSPHFRISAGR